MDIVLSEKDVRRFWRKVDRRGPDECWLWLAGKQDHGHGQMWINSLKMNVKAHRISYVLEKGIQPGLLDVLHNCPGGDNSSCVNPAHLWLGTQADNNRDKDAKGRGNHAKGARNPNTKLDPSRVPELRKQRAAGRTYKSLGEEHGVSIQAIWAAVNGITWSHVP
jgi:hypothetical protein